MQILPVADEGLGNTSYVVAPGDGSALVLDAFRDPAPYLALAERHGWRLRFAVETHLHADFVSGSRELAAHGAQVVASGRAPLAFPARHVADGDELDVGGLTLRAIATPGHTPEHLAWLLSDGRAPLALFSGGTLIAGGVARPDLLGPEHTDGLARAAYRSIHDRLLLLPDDLPVHPTHGAGSFCSTAAAHEGATTIGRERAANPLLAADGEDEFVRRLLGGLGSYPPYFLELREVNRSGPRVYGAVPPALAPLSPAEVERLVEDGAELVDVRPVEAFAAGHVPGSLSNPLRAQFATWLGWLAARERLLVFVGGPGTDRDAVVRAALSIGFERLAGELAGGVQAWEDSGRPVSRIPLVTPSQGAAAARAGAVLDVRQAAEWRAGHVAGARHVELGRVATAGDAELGGGPLLVHCGHGERAMTAASLLARRGREGLRVLDGGPEALAEAAGHRLQSGR